MQAPAVVMPCSVTANHRNGLAIQKAVTLLVFRGCILSSSGNNVCISGFRQFVLDRFYRFLLMYVVFLLFLSFFHVVCISCVYVFFV